MRLIKTLTVLAIVAGMLAAMTASAQATLTTAERAQRDAGFIADEQNNNGSIPSFSTIGSTADAVVSLTAANRGDDEIRKALRYLAHQVELGHVNSIGQKAKVALAAIAGARDPGAFGGEVLIGDILASEQPDGRYGEFTPVFDQADAILALVGAGETPSSDALNWLANAQCPDGGWQFDEPYDGGVEDDQHCFNGDLYDFQTETNASSLAVQALEAADGPSPAVDPFDFFADIRDDAYDGWGYDWTYNTTDANSTGMVLQAYKAAGETPPTGANAALLALQYKACGGFAYSWISEGDRTPADLGASVGALPGLVKDPLPIDPHHVTKPAPDTPDCPE